MKVLVSGANGFLSGHVIQALLSRGYAVRAMMRTGAQAPALAGLPIEIFHGNITHPADLQLAVKDCDIVIHAAADTSQSHRKAADYYPINVHATEEIIRAVAAAGCKRLIYVSTANTTGFGSADVPGNENTPMSPWAQKSGYAISKLAAQNRVLEAVKTGTINAVVVNPTFMIGPGDYKPSSGRIFQMILGKKVVFCPPGGKNFVDVRDAAMAIVNAIELGKKGECYLLAGNNLSYREFFKKVNEKSKQTSLLLGIPAFVLQIAGNIGELLRLAGIKTALNSANAQFLCRPTYLDNTKAVQTLKLPSGDIDKTIADYLRWKGI